MYDHVDAEIMQIPDVLEVHRHGGDGSGEFSVPDLAEGIHVGMVFRHRQNNDLDQTVADHATPRRWQFPTPIATQ